MSVSEAQSLSNTTGIEIKSISGSGISNQTQLQNSTSYTSTVSITYTLDASFGIGKTVELNIYGSGIGEYSFYCY